MERAQIRADREVLPEVRKAGFWVEPILQIHDELVMEMDEGAAPIMDAWMMQAMVQDSHMMAVPIAASSSTGTDWGELK